MLNGYMFTKFHQSLFQFVSKMLLVSRVDEKIPRRNESSTENYSSEECPMQLC